MKKFKIIPFTLAICLMITSTAYAKPKEDNRVNEINTAPVAGFGANAFHRKNYDILLVTDYEGQKLSDVTSVLNSLKSDAYAENVDLKYSVISSKQRIGTQTKTVVDTKYVTRTRTYRDSTPPDSIYYNSSPYSGTLWADGDYECNVTGEEGDSREVETTRTGGAYDLWKYSGGSWNYYGSRRYGNVPSSINYNSGGYSGTLTLYDSERAGGDVGGDTPTGEGREGEIRRGANYTDIYYYRGTVIKSDTRVWWYTQTYSGYVTGTITKYYDVNSLDMDKLRQCSFRNNSKHYILMVSDGKSTEYNDSWGKTYSFAALNKEIMRYCIETDSTVYTVVPNEIRDLKINNNYDTNCNVQEITLNELMSKVIEGKFYNEGQWQMAINDIRSECKNYLEPINDYLIADEDKLIYDKKYEDYESDKKVNERWMYKHNSSYFENSSGTVDYSGIWLNSPIDIFAKVGKYNITYQAQDDPTGEKPFEPYKKWSISENQMTILAHRRPIAKFMYRLNKQSGNKLNIVIEDASYDLDHFSESNKGIVNTEWRWKKAGDTVWNETMPKELNINEIYLIRYRVQDKDGADGYGAWSYPYVQMIDTSSDNNNAPVASFIVQKEIPQGTDYAISDESYDVDNDPIVKWHFKLYDEDGINILRDFGETSSFIKPDLKNLSIGKYQLQLTVTDNPKLRNSSLTPKNSLPYSQTIEITKNIVNNPPVANFTVQNPLTTTSKILVTDKSTDIDGDPIISWKWAIKYKDDQEWKYFDKLPETLEDAGYIFDGQYTFGLTVMDNPTIRDKRLKPLWSEWHYITVNVDVDLQLKAHTEKVEEVKYGVPKLKETSTFKAGNGVVIKGETIGRAYRVEAWLILNNGELSTAQLLPDNQLSSPPQKLMTWHSRYTKKEGYEKNLIIPKNTPNGSYTVKVRAYRRKGDGTDKVVEVNLPITVNGKIDIKTEIITE